MVKLSSPYIVKLTHRDLLHIEEALKLASQMEDNAIHHADEPYNPGYKVLHKHIQSIIEKEDVNG